MFLLHQNTPTLHYTETNCPHSFSITVMLVSFIFSGHYQTYVLEHLATFTVSPDNDMLYPADGMRRLLAMEKTNGIWTQKMLMKLDRGKEKSSHRKKCDMLARIGHFLKMR